MNSETFKYDLNDTSGSKEYANLLKFENSMLFSNFNKLAHSGDKQVKVALIKKYLQTTFKVVH